jgi:hypothetical protein
MKLERKRQLGKPRRRWEYNIIIDPREIVWEFVDWFALTQDTGCCVHGHENASSVKYGEILD